MVSNIRIIAPYRRMGVNIIRSPGRIDTFQHLLFFTKLRFEPQILAKIGLKSTSGNSLNPKLCQVLTITGSNNANKMWRLSQIEAFFCASSLTLAPPPARLSAGEEFIRLKTRQADEYCPQRIA
ncbi:hypothetical protein BFF41_01300 [Salmonella enterica subsp. enterica serovar Senftenberg]|nr:hypothetical protein BFF41_01300 [Salmonella enterica subsp. enterica serovar Senftenberg]